MDDLHDLIAYFIAGLLCGILAFFIGMVYVFTKGFEYILFVMVLLYLLKILLL